MAEITVDLKINSNIDELIEKAKYLQGLIGDDDECDCLVCNLEKLCDIIHNNDNLSNIAKLKLQIIIQEEIEKYIEINQVEVVKEKKENFIRNLRDEVKRKVKND